MTPLDHHRLSKAAADCGFEMTPLTRPAGLELRSARFPETVFVRVVGQKVFEVTASDAFILGADDGVGTLQAEGFGELYKLLRTAAAGARTRPNRVSDAFKQQTAGLPKTTDAERLVVQRVGQGLFRAALLDYWQGRCCVTGLDVPELLRASHIRPWAHCETDEQRLDVFNGLLLAPQLDALFDAGLMTVDATGSVLISSIVTPARRQQLGLPDQMTVHGLQSAHRKYLDFHAVAVWRGAGRGAPGHGG